MSKRIRLALATALLVLFAAGAVWGVRSDPRKINPIPPFKEHEPPDYLITSAPAIFQTTIHSPRDTIIGDSYYDIQHCCRLLRMNALDYQEPPGLHFTLTRMNESMSARYVDYTYLDTSGWKVLPAPAIIKGGHWAGFTTLDVIRPLEGYFKSHSRAVLCYHSIFGVPEEKYTVLSIEPNTPGAIEMEGSYYWYDIPDAFNGSENHAHFPSCGVDSLNRIHMALFESEYWVHWLGYVRCEERSGDKLMCWAPGKDSVILDKETYYTDQDYEVAVFGESYVETQIVATSKVSNKVALIWASFVEADPDSHTTVYDVFYIESTNGGDDWFDAGVFPQRTNITRYDEDDYVRAFCDLAAVYDMNDSLHIFWHTRHIHPQTKTFDLNDVTLWHWSKATERVCDGETLVANEVAHAEWEAVSGMWNSLISKMQVGVGYDPELPNFNYLYLVWVQFDSGQTSQGGYTQGDIYISVSTDGGLVWQTPLNITKSTVPDCAPGECASDHYPSIAERVDTAVYLQWFYDLDAGAALYDEGMLTNNPVLFYHLPVDSIPIDEVVRIDWNPKNLVDSYVHTPLNGQDTVYLTIENTGTDTLHVYNIFSDAGWLSINPTSAILPPGECPVNVELIATAGSIEEFKVDSIRIQSNDQAGNDDFWVVVHAVFSNVYAEPEFVVVSNPIYYLSESNTGNLGHQNDTAGFCLYQQGYWNRPNLLTDGSPVLAFTSPDGDSLVARFIFDEHYFLPETELSVDTSSNLRTIVVEAEFCPVTPQAPFPWHHRWWYWTIKMRDYIFYSWEGEGLGTENKNEQYVALKYIQLYYNPSPPWWPFDTLFTTIPVHYLGMALDIDCPAKKETWNTPFIDSTRRMAFLEGYDIWDSGDYYRMGMAQKDACFQDTLGNTYCWPATADDRPYAMHILRNDAFIYPQSGYHDDSLYKYMSSPGYSIYGSGGEADYNIVTTGKVIPTQSFPPADTYAVAYALIISDKYYVRYLDTLVDIVMCGNVNRDSKVDITDVVYFVNYQFKSGPGIWNYMGDCDGNGTIDVIDIVYLINYLFKTGPPPQCSSL